MLQLKSASYTSIKNLFFLITEFILCFMYEWLLMIGHSHFHVVMIAEDDCSVGEGLKRTREEGDDEEERSGGPMFDPPVYKQRYTAVLELARRQEPKTVSLHNLLL